MLRGNYYASVEKYGEALKKLPAMTGIVKSDIQNDSVIAIKIRLLYNRGSALSIDGEAEKAIEV